MKNLNFLLFIILLFQLGCSINSKYHIAHDLYMDSNYATAIEHFDNFLASHSQGSLATRAELERSDCYYQLGYKAYEKQNWLLASRLFYLSNSIIADSKLDECYKELAIEAISKQDTSKAMEYYSYIIQYLPDSELIPEMLFNRCNIYLAKAENLTAFNDYHQLWSNFPDSEYRRSIQPEIDILLPDFMQEAIEMKANKEYEAALDICFRLSKYPSKLQSDIINEIGNLYWLMAESEITQNNLKKARQYYDNVYEHCPERKAETLARIEEICSNFILSGNEMEKILNFDNAISTYSKCFKLVENHPVAAEKISKAREAKSKYLQAKDKMRLAEEKERLKEHKQALTLYTQSNNLFSTAEAKKKIFIMQNILEAEKDPKTFARNIVSNYQGGILLRKVSIVEDYMKEKFGDVVKPSGWKVTYSIGLYKYEVRYDILSTFGNFYFAWRVDLKTRTVSPSNKISELLETDIDEVLGQVE